MAVGVAWTTLSHSHRDSYAARPIRAEGLAPCGSVRALASLSAAFYKLSVPSLMRWLMSLQLHTEKVIGTICASAVSAAVPAANARGTALPARRVQQLVTNYFVGPVGTV